MTVARGRPATQRDRILARAVEMKAAGERVNKSRIARELHVPIRTVFRSLSNSRDRGRASVRIVASDIERFEQLVDKSEGQGPHGECWTWRGPIGTSGYGRFQETTATHFALAIAGKGKPHPSAHALHSCDYKICVREDHLRWGEVIDNAVDFQERAEKAKAWLTDDQVREVRSSPERGVDIAVRLGVSQACISNIRRRVHRANVT